MEFDKKYYGEIDEHSMICTQQKNSMHNLSSWKIIKKVVKNIQLIRIVYIYKFYCIHVVKLPS